MHRILLSCLGAAHSCLNKLQKRMFRTASPSLASSLEPWAYHQNVASISLFYSYYFGRCLFCTGSTGFTSLFFLILEGSLLAILIDCTIFLSPFLDVTRISMSTGPFRRFSTRLCQNACINTIRRAMVYNVYFSFSKIL